MTTGFPAVPPTEPQAGQAGPPLAGRVAIVSGGGRGLGRSFCLALARQGARVVVNNRHRVVDAGGRGSADHVADQITAAGGEAVAEYSDAADPGAGQAMVAAALRRWGRLDICVANAAIGVGGMFHKQPGSCGSCRCRCRSRCTACWW